MLRKSLFGLWHSRDIKDRSNWKMKTSQEKAKAVKYKTANRRAAKPIVALKV